MAAITTTSVALSVAEVKVELIPEPFDHHIHTAAVSVSSYSPGHSNKKQFLKQSVSRFVMDFMNYVSGSSVCLETLGESITSCGL